jgi:MFS superfamily sulfate permease-like transporter
MAWLTGDIFAGVMLAAIAVPEQLATARLAGFAPEIGLVAFAVGSLAYAAFGDNPYVSVGADSTIAPIFAGAIAAMVSLGNVGSIGYTSLVGVLAIAVGAVLLIVSIARAGWLANLLSLPVIAGFLTGIAVHIVVGQLPALLGLPGANGALLARLVKITNDLPQSNGADIAIGSSVFALAYLSSRVNKRIPGALIGLVVASLAASVWPLARHGVLVLGEIPGTIPVLRVPATPGFNQLVALLPLTLVVAAVCIMQTSAVARSFPAPASAEPSIDRDCLALGIGSAFAGILGSFPVDASPPRTALVKESGGNSQVAGLTAVCGVAVVALAASPLLAYIPDAALAGILIYIATHIMRCSDIARIAKYSRREFQLLVVAALLVVVLPIQTGMLFAIVLSLVHGVQMMMWPPWTELVNVAGTTIWWPSRDEPSGVRVPGVLVFAPSAPINFTNAQYIRDRLLALVGRSDSHVRLVVIDASSVTDIDYTGSQTMQRTIGELRARGTDVALTRLIVTHAQTAAQRSGLIAALGSDHVFMSVDEAVKRLQNVP